MLSNLDSISKESWDFMNGGPLVETMESGFLG